MGRAKKNRTTAAIAENQPIVPGTVGVVQQGISTAAGVAGVIADAVVTPVVSNVVATVALLRAAALGTPCAPLIDGATPPTVQGMAVPTMPAYSKRGAALACWLACSEQRTAAAVLLVICGGALTRRNNTGLCKGEQRGAHAALLGYIKPGATWWGNATVRVEAARLRTVVESIRDYSLQCVDPTPNMADLRKVYVSAKAATVQPVEVQPVEVQPVEIGAAVELNAPIENVP